MKKSILLFLLTSTSICCYSQVLFHHKLSTSRLTRFGFRLVDQAGNAKDLCTTRNGVISVSGGKISFDLWQIQDANTCPNGIDATSTITPLSIVQNRATFGDPTLILRVPYQAVTIGVNTLPFRYRFKVKPNDSTTISGTGTSSFSLALNAGYTFGISSITTRAINNYSFTVGAYVGPSTTDLKKNVYKDPSKYVSDRTVATMTYGVNIILARNNLGLVFALGWEKALGTNGDQWVFNNEPYFGFGINTSFGR